MTVHKVSPEYLAEIQRWWRERDMGTMPEELLPPASAVAVDAMGEPLAAAWLYEPEGCEVAIVDWLVTRQGLRPQVSRLACRLVFAKLEDRARKGGYTRIFVAVERKAMVPEVEACGFTLAASEMTHLVKAI